MNTKINPRRIIVMLAVVLMLSGVVAITATGQLVQVVASVGGYIQANFDLLSGKRELQVSAHKIGPRSQVASRVSGLGLKTSEKYYVCLSSTPCGAYHRAYDALVRKAVNRSFGYDIFTEIQNLPPSRISIVIQHK